MHRNSPIVIGVVAAILAQSCIVSEAVTTNSPPLVVSLLNAEPAGIFEDNGVEMWLVTVGISNALPTSMAGPHFEPVYIKSADVPVEARVERQWTRIEGVIGKCALHPYGSETHRILLVVPAKTDRIRIPFKYASATVINGELAWFTEGLPASIRTNLPPSFWRYAGPHVRYGPSSYWQDGMVELPLRLISELDNEPMQPRPR